MKANLLYADGQAGPAGPAPQHSTELADDLELDLLLGAMAGGDQYLYDVAREVLLASLTSADQIRYRQAILADWLQNPDTALALYRLATDAIGAEQRTRADAFSSPGYLLNRSVQVMEAYAGLLRKLRGIADQQAGRFHSPGCSALLSTLRAELGDAYLAQVELHLRQLRFRGGLLMTASPGTASTGTDYALGRPDSGRGALRGLLAPGSGPARYVLDVPERDVTGRQTLSGIRDHGIGEVAGALAQSCEHIRGFFEQLRREVAFYLGCLHLHERLAERGQPTCMPVPLPAGRPVLTARGLVDAALALSLDAQVVANDVAADGKALVLITGANQGGKSTFLRSAGLAQLMMQCGMFVTASEFSANVCGAVYTHFSRPEDVTMTSGKLDEELARMSEIIDAIKPGCLLLCNESFAATNEREGSHIARAVISALLDSGVKVLAVTHFFELARGLFADARDDALFLRADRQPDGSRTFRLAAGEPLPTGHAADVYARVFGEPLHGPGTAPQAGG